MAYEAMPAPPLVGARYDGSRAGRGTSGPLAHIRRHRLLAPVRRQANGWPRARPADDRSAPQRLDVFPFFVGSGRSGTTLVRAIFDSHPDLAIPDEVSFVIRYARPHYALRYGWPRRFDAAACTDLILANASFRGGACRART